MKYVFISVSSGIIDEVTFFDDREKAVEKLHHFCVSMNVEEDDAVVYGPDGLIANTKDFLDDQDRFIEPRKKPHEVETEDDKPVYLIADPHSRLGFMVVSPDDPLGYENVLEAVSELGQMRKERGSHLKLYRVIQIQGALVDKAELEKYNESIWAESFDYNLVKEYLI